MYPLKTLFRFYITAQYRERDRSLEMISVFRIAQASEKDFKKAIKELDDG